MFDQLVGRVADGHEVYCRLCGNGGDIYGCDETLADTGKICPYSFCVECIQRCFGEREVYISEYDVCRCFWFSAALVARGRMFLSRLYSVFFIFFFCDVCLFFLFCFISYTFFFLVRCKKRHGPLNYQSVGMGGVPVVGYLRYSSSLRGLVSCVFVRSNERCTGICFRLSSIPKDDGRGFILSLSGLSFSVRYKSCAKVFISRWLFCAVSKNGSREFPMGASVGFLQNDGRR